MTWQERIKTKQILGDDYEGINIGDKMLIRSELSTLENENDEVNSVGVNSHMMDLEGETVTITGAKHSTTGQYPVYHIKEDHGRFVWHRLMFVEKVS